MPWEISMINLIGQLRNPTPDSFMVFATQLGSGTFIIISSILIILMLIISKKFNCAWIIAISLLGQEIISSLIKHLVARARPDILTHLVQADGYSFPSGHSLAAAVFYGLLAYLLTQSIKKPVYRYGIWILAFGLIVLVGFSRIYLGVHWPTDILGGILLGFLWIFLVVSVFNKRPLC
jgi:undecaprenyl-diphosphatase